METVLDLYNEVRTLFPDVSVKADRAYVTYWDDRLPHAEYTWFHCLANALNEEMCKGVAPRQYAPLFGFLNTVLRECSKDIHGCINVSFTENLFWEVPREKAEPYWRALPGQLKFLYLDFHRWAPAWMKE